MLITAVAKEYKKWYVSTKQKLQEEGKPSSNEVLEKMWLDHMSKADTSGMMKYIHHEDRGARTAIQFNGSKPTETLVLAVKDNKDGTITVATLEHGTYTFANGSMKSVNTAKGGQVMMPIMENIQRQSEVAGVSGFNMPFTPLSAAANEWASKYMLIGLAEKSGGVLGPLIKKAHISAKKKSDLYNHTVNLLVDGYRDSLLVQKMKVMLNLTGDVDRYKLSEVMNIAYQNARHTQEVLATELPKLDKWIERSVRSKEDRAKIDYIIGRSGFMHLLDNTEVMAELNKGEKEINDILAMVPHNTMQLKEATDLMKYQMYGEVTNGRINSNGSKTIEQLAAILALKEDGNWDTFKRLKKVDNGKLYVELLRLSGMNKSLHEVVHLGRTNRVGTGSGKVYTGYDGNGILDVYDGAHEYAYTTQDKLNEYLKDPRWKIVRPLKEEDKSDKGKLILLAREGTGSFQDGLGLDKNIIRNGVPIDTKYVRDMTRQFGDSWIEKNNIVMDMDNGYERYRVVLNNEDKVRNGLKSNIAHTLYRTWVHNAQLVEMGTIQKMAVESMTETGEVGLDNIIRNIKHNAVAEEKKELKPFISTEMTYDELAEKYPEIYKMYTPVKNISDYGAFSSVVKYVRKDMEDILIGYPKGSLLKDDTTLGITLQRAETVYKQLVQMIKLKMVVANPVKLGMDIVSNTTLLMSMDVDMGEIAKGYPEGAKYANEMSGLEGELVLAKIELAKAEAMHEDMTGIDKKIKKIEDRIKKHPFNHALKHGFIQSHGTSMLVKEMDTITGLQKTIDDVVKLVVQDQKGNPNKVHDAIVWFMNAGFGIDDMLNSVGNMSKLKGTTFGEELTGIADRIADKKMSKVIKDEQDRLGRKLSEDEVREIQKDADTVRYISEFIAAPSSELVRQGSRAMQLGDLVGRWTLYIHEVKKGLKKAGVRVDGMSTEELLLALDVTEGSKEIEKQAATFATDTFIDYRMNLPKEIQVLSDYGVLMFPAFWMRAQKVIWNLAKYHPINAGAGLLVTDLLGIDGASIMDASLPNKIMSGTIAAAGQNVLSPGTILLGF